MNVSFYKQSSWVSRVVCWTVFTVVFPRYIEIRVSLVNKIIILNILYSKNYIFDRQPIAFFFYETIIKVLLLWLQNGLSLLKWVVRLSRSPNRLTFSVFDPANFIRAWWFSERNISNLGFIKRRRRTFYLQLWFPYGNLLLTFVLIRSRCFLTVTDFSFPLSCNSLLEFSVELLPLFSYLCSSALFFNWMFSEPRHHAKLLACSSPERSFFA